MNIIIHYASNSSVEILCFLLESQIKFKSIYVHDDDPKKIKLGELKSIYKDLLVLKKFDEIRNIENSYSIISIGDCDLRDYKYQQIKSLNLKFLTFVHEKAYVNKYAKIGKGCIIGPYTIIAPMAQIKDNCIINSNSICGHHSIIGRSSIVSPHSSILGGAKLGNRVLMGSGSSINSNIKISSDVKVTSNSVVYKDIYKKKLIHGNPAK